MFGRKKEEGKVKIKEPSPTELKKRRIAEEIEKLSPRQTLIYRLPELYWSSFAGFFIVEANPDYPQKGKRFLMSTDMAVEGGKPAGKKRHLWESDKPQQVADWVGDRDGDLYS